LPVLTAALARVAEGVPTALAIVVETEGSVYARTSTLAVFVGDSHIGWISGGCLEPALLASAEIAVRETTLRLIEIDTRDDTAMFSGAATGCRGRQIVAFIPLCAVAGLPEIVDRWQAGAGLQFEIAGGGRIRISSGEILFEAELPVVCEEPMSGHSAWSILIPPPPRVLLLGAGPEALHLVPLLRDLGWKVVSREPREAWQGRLTEDDRSSSAVPLDRLLMDFEPDATLAMHHSFELDLEALSALASSPCTFIGLLGPARRREDLLKLLPEELRLELTHRLRSPVGLSLGGTGPAGIALSICAQLEQWRHGA